MTNREKINRALKRKTNDSPKVPTSVIPKREIATVTSSPVVVTAGASLSNNLPAPYPETEVKLIAFYLPQFHPIPENDQWWGKGFTEWTGVSAARPYFEGHYQPHLPADLGFYDLRVAEVREAQANMARDHGIHGFCYYFYWFSGRRILERPLNEMLQSKRPDFPFCVCWANEPWSRRWDGSESELLISQQHEINIDKGLILDLLPLFDDPRYIKVDGKPLLVIYRVALLPDPVALFEHFRSVVRDH